MYPVLIKKYVIAFILIAACIVHADSESHGDIQPPDTIISIEAMPGITLPVAGDESLYETGILSRLFVSHRLKNLPLISLEAGGEYDIIPIKALISMSVFGGSAGAGLNFDLSPRILLRLSALAGYSYSIINSGVSKGEGAGGFYFTGGTDVTYRINQAWKAGIGSSYVNHSSLYQGARITAVAGYHVNLDSTHAVKVDKNEFIDIFPALFNYHNTIPVGTAVIRNTEKYNSRDLSHELVIKKYMDEKITAAGLEVLPGNQESVIAFMPEFNDSIKAVSGDRDSVEIPVKAYVKYSYNDWLYREKIEKNIVVYNRNSITWDDPLKVSVFVTPGDSEVVKAKDNALNAVRDRSAIPVSGKILKALAIFKALEISGISHLEDQSTPYEKHVKAPYPVDRLRYPSQMLAGGSGESDELAILYCSMLEAEGFSTALIALPDACFAAFALEDDVAFSHADEMIKHENKSWVPVDMRSLAGSFDSAIVSALENWKNCPGEERKIFSLESARKKYLEPSPPEPAAATLPAADGVVEAYLEAIKSYAYWEIAPEEGMLKEIQKRSSYDPDITNRLGVLYARFEKYQEAYAEFERASASGLPPAMVNLANLYFLDNKLEKALPLYEEAYRKNAYNASMLRNMAVAYYRRLDFGLAREVYRKLEFIDSGMASEVSFMAQRTPGMIEAAGAGRSAAITVMKKFPDNSAAARGDRYYIDGKLNQALSNYERALLSDPGNSDLILAVARVNYEMDNYYRAGQYHGILSEKDPESAEKNRYLVSGNISAVREIALNNLRGDVKWAE